MLAFLYPRRKQKSILFLYHPASTFWLKFSLCVYELLKGFFSVCMLCYKLLLAKIFNFVKYVGLLCLFVCVSMSVCLSALDRPQFYSYTNEISLKVVNYEQLEFITFWSYSGSDRSSFRFFALAQKLFDIQTSGCLHLAHNKILVI